MRWPAALGIVALAGTFAAAPGGAEEMGDAEAGARIFEACRVCHQIGPGARHTVGPHLNGLFGRPAGTLEGFDYSRSLQRAGTSGLEWHADTLSAYLENPRAFASGTRMRFPGLADAGERADVIAYLREFSDDPGNIPEADPTATGTDHAVDPAILAIQGDPEYGAYLSSECTSCHQLGGEDAGIPSIVHWPEENFVLAMQAYKQKQRPHPVMQMIAGRLSDEEIAALAAYFNKPE